MQVAGVDGAPGCAPSSEALLVSEHDSGKTTDTPFSASLTVPASPSGLHLAQLGMPPLPSILAVGAPPPSETKVDAQPGFNISFSVFLSLLTDIRKFREIDEISKKQFKYFGQIQIQALKII